ncbi:ubiquinone biosynthesis protein UbiH [Budviciaceae bacterium BWR-B9]|uniref:Ubiquinone biosynthesis protein UbiH n=1 Tax=Limnobaculum allomyrinae TaxID=2791986 RepID=A0ABS1IT14_9GAMM|nr:MULTISPECIES: ubiquinone biosynthesis protein UbiH [Limnobaculum]MBK5144827.1 ubiquinone biosynthesis protein UbiH [Limnobaculum allomyrinae]MBV7692490.1 ubiquinone biosynthesis protein UbiH [Limnobaculum sp. M2-1]
MTLFLQNCLAFPVIIFSGLLLIVLFYWICASFGLLDIDILNIDGIDADIDAGDISGIAGWMTKLGLAGIPLTIIITFITLIGWLLSYFTVHLMLRFIETDILRYLLGTVALFLIGFIALLITSFLLRPLQPKLTKMKQGQGVKNLIGKVAEVRSSVVTEQRGEALMEDGGAGLILQIRAPQDAEIVRGDRVVLISYDTATNSYNVVSELEFNRL